MKNRLDIIEHVNEQMDVLNSSAAEVETSLLDKDMAPYQRLVNYDALVTKLRKLALDLERARGLVQ